MRDDATVLLRGVWDPHGLRDRAPNDIEGSSQLRESEACESRSTERVLALIEVVLSQP